MSNIITPAQMVPKMKPKLIATMLPKVIGVWGNALTAFLNGSGFRVTSIEAVSSKKRLTIGKICIIALMIRRCEVQ